MDWISALLAYDLLPDPVLGWGIRRLLKARLRAEDPGSQAALQERQDRWIAELRASPIAIDTAAANAQHYEVPSDFFVQVLGRHLKYSSAFWPDGVTTLDQAETAMLELSTARAEIADGQEILELGCGWGSLTLYLAERFPAANVLAISNSRTQKDFIDQQAAARGIRNVVVETADINAFTTSRRFDRVVSIEMFEHVRNYQQLFARIASWMHPQAKLFVHIFCHRRLAYPFTVRDATDFMAKYFFTGGLMPSADLLLEFQDPLLLDERWLVSGTHYARTARAWLANMDHNRAQILSIFRTVYGPEAQRFWVYWRVFFLACAELFAYRDGTEWLVAHYRFRHP